MAKQNANLTGIGELLGNFSNDFTFLNPPLISAPNTQITDLSGNPRQLPDPSKTLKPAIGIERLEGYSLNLLRNEKGPNGEAVYSMDNQDTRVRFFGNGWNQESDLYGATIITAIANDAVEITFYGTGLNLLTIIDATARDIRATVDGGVESGDLYTEGSAVLNARNYRTNHIIPVPTTPTNLALGVHTIKLRLVSGANFRFYGVEILNNSTQIKIPQGEAISSGRKLTNASLQSVDYNTGFDGNPVLNGRGGKVVTYLTSSGVVGKAIQQTNASQANMTSADHTNEEVIRRINFREFGANRADDFSTLAGVASDRYFTLDDGTTTLTGNDVLSNNNSVQTQLVNAFMTITFVGTGLDLFIEMIGASTLSAAQDISVDGASIFNGQLSQPQSNSKLILKIVSGLPYGTHTVKVMKTVANGTWDFGIVDFIIYGPKEPTIPTGSIKLSEHYLMADYSHLGATTTTEGMSRGVLRKSAFREMTYTGTWATGVDVISWPSGGFIRTITAANTVKYTFWGTGFELRARTGAGYFTSSTINVDGSTNFTGRTVSATSSYVFNSATGDLNASGGSDVASSFSIRGFSLGLHTLTITRNTGNNLDISTIDIITPVHSYNTKSGSQSMGPSVKMLKAQQESKVDLSKAKALLNFSGISSTIRSSQNISSVVTVTTGQYRVFFEKPMKNSKYIVLSGGNATDDTVLTTQARQGPAISQLRTDSFTVQTGSDTTATNVWDNIFLAVFGELENED